MTEVKKQRHKCTFCGRVRYEEKMEPVKCYFGRDNQEAVTRFGHQVWVCSDNPDCLQRAEKFWNVY